MDASIIYSTSQFTDSSSLEPPLHMTLLQYIIMYSGRYIQNFGIMLTFTRYKHSRSNWQAKGRKNEQVYST